jgi:hypothetical protein
MGKSYASSLKEGAKKVEEKVKEEKVKEVKVKEEKVKEEKVKEEKVKEEKVKEEKKEECINIYKDMYEKLYQEMYENMKITKDGSSKSLLLENISLKTHIQYLHMKIDELSKSKSDLDEEIGRTFYEKVANHSASQ